MIPRSLCFLLLLAATSSSAQAPRAMPLAHDPSSIIRDGGLYYVFVTGPGIPFLSSPDAQTWTRRGSVFAALPPALVDLAPGNDGVEAWAPDIIKLGQTFYLYYAVSHWNSFASVIALATNTTLDPADPAYHWQDRGLIVRSNGTEDLNAIDPGVILAPDSTLWLSFGSYHGPVDLIQLDPKTGLRIRQDSPTFIIARDSEASDIIAHDGFFYLFVNHGSCCKGSESTYRIHVGRSKKITGPYVDRKGKPLTKKPGESFLVSEGDRIGPGHFRKDPGRRSRRRRRGRTGTLQHPLRVRTGSPRQIDAGRRNAALVLRWVAGGWHH